MKQIGNIYLIAAISVIGKLTFRSAAILVKTHGN
jgi:hypothetical protein